MADLLGENHYQMDPKGRISLPTKFRDEFGEGVYLTLGQDGCLYAFPREEWELERARVKGLVISAGSNRAYARMFFGNAERVELDAQGRLVIPRKLREAIHLGREVTVLGVADRLEIWAKDAWERYSQALEGSYSAGTLAPESG